MNEVHVEKFHAFLAEHGLNVADTNDYLRRLDRKVFIDPTLDKHREVEDHVSRFVSEFVKEVHEQVPGLNLRTMTSGSYYSKARVGRPYEFDFMLEIPLTNVKVKRVKDTVFYKVVILEKEDIKWFEKVSSIETVMYDSCDGRTLFVGEFMERLTTLFGQCTHSLDDAWKLKKFGYRANSPAFEVIMMYQENPILLDLVPCIHVPFEQVDEIPEINKDLCELVAHIVKETPEMTYLLRQNKIVEPLTKKTVLQLIHQNLYLVFNDDLCARLSTSMIEKLIFLGLHDDFLAVLRLAKYLIQTFHIPVTSFVPPYLEMPSHENGVFGLSSAIPSRYLTMFFLELIFATPYTKTGEKSDEDNLGWRVISILRATQCRGLCFIKDRSIASVFPGVNTDFVKPFKTNQMEERFHFNNLGIIVDFLLKSIKENSMDHMSLTSSQNHVRCPKCWGEDMEETLDAYQMRDIVKYFPKTLCCLHNYLQG